jgi:hypothetical protein
LLSIGIKKKGKMSLHRTSPLGETIGFLPFICKGKVNRVSYGYLLIKFKTFSYSLLKGKGLRRSPWAIGPMLLKILKLEYKLNYRERGKNNKFVPTHKESEAFLPI